MYTNNGSWCMGFKGEISGTVCVTFTWDMHIYIYIYIYIYLYIFIHIYIHIWVVYSFCLFYCSFTVVTWWYMWCIVWASGNQEGVQACLVTLIWLDKNQNHLLQSRNDVLMSLVERVHQGENLVHWLNWLTEHPAVCQSVIMGDLPSEGDHQAELCKAWPS